MHEKLIVILGPTASGKTDLSINLAKKYKGEIVSADSRQVYKGLDIGSGKISKKEMKGIKHHLLDVANPKNTFTVSQYQKLATRSIKDIQQRGKTPFLVGGTGFYIQSIIEGLILPNVKPNKKLRKELEKRSTQDLYKILLALDPERAKTIDVKNPVRLVRAIEIAKETPITPLQKNPQFEVLQLGIKKSPAQLKKLIEKRLLKRAKDIITEVKKLRRQGISFKRLDELGLEYRYGALCVQDKLSYQQMLNLLQKEIEHFSKRQMTWFKRDKTIHWVKNVKEAQKHIKKFIQ